MEEDDSQLSVADSQDPRILLYLMAPGMAMLHPFLNVVRYELNYLP